MKNTWGGKRKGSGRKPKGKRAGTTHQRRPAFDARYPVHVAMKVVPGIEDLRLRKCFHVIEGAFFANRENVSCRLVHFSVQTNHLHLVVEASDAKALSKGMQSLAIRLARGLNRLLGRKGSVFADRYYARPLKTPREVNVCLQYVLNNRRRHQRRLHFAKGWIDPFSSGNYFSGWRSRTSSLPRPSPWPVALPQSWLLREGWRKWGPIEIDKRPGPSDLASR
ncbi:MAG: transposase [Deltaproteobacteria bacterium]|nr:transposase [Deltaproteobacteria bacterium]